MNNNYNTVINDVMVIINNYRNIDHYLAFTTGRCDVNTMHTVTVSITDRVGEDDCEDLEFDTRKKSKKEENEAARMKRKKNKGGGAG